MKLILIVGSWGSGTTAVIGALDKIGVPTLGPHFQSNDERTLNTYELISFRDLIFTYVNEETIEHKDNYANDFIPALKKYKLGLEKTGKKTIALKMPLASICLPEICSVFDTKIILVHRPLQEIEASRIRRNWPSVFGYIGATKIYNTLFSDLMKHKLSFLGISYDDIVYNTDGTLKKIIQYSELQHSKNHLKNVKNFIKKY